MQQARDRCRGGNHRGGAKPRGWNERGGWYPTCRSNGRKVVTGVDAHRYVDEEGMQAVDQRWSAGRIPRESGEEKPGRGRHTERERSPWRAFSAQRKKRRNTESARAPNAGSKEPRRGGWQERPTTCGGSRWGIEASHKQASPRTSKVP